jgi:hypothetical protein
MQCRSSKLELVQLSGKLSHSFIKLGDFCGTQELHFHKLMTKISKHQRLYILYICTYVESESQLSPATMYSFLQKVISGKKLPVTYNVN